MIKSEFPEYTFLSQRLSLMTNFVPIVLILCASLSVLALSLSWTLVVYKVSHPHYYPQSLFLTLLFMTLHPFSSSHTQHEASEITSSPLCKTISKSSPCPGPWGGLFFCVNLSPATLLVPSLLSGSLVRSQLHQAHAA